MVAIEKKFVRSAVSMFAMSVLAFACNSNVKQSPPFSKTDPSKTDSAQTPSPQVQLEMAGPVGDEESFAGNLTRVDVEVNFKSGAVSVGYSYFDTDLKAILPEVWLTGTLDEKEHSAHLTNPRSMLDVDGFIQCSPDDCRISTVFITKNQGKQKGIALITRETFNKLDVMSETSKKALEGDSIDTVQSVITRDFSYGKITDGQLVVTSIRDGKAFYHLKLESKFEDDYKAVWLRGETGKNAKIETHRCWEEKCVFETHFSKYLIGDAAFDSTKSTLEITLPAEGEKLPTFIRVQPSQSAN